MPVFGLFLLLVPELSLLTISSKAVRNDVELYRQMSSTQGKILPCHVKHSEAIPQDQLPVHMNQFKELGIANI